MKTPISDINLFRQRELLNEAKLRFERTNATSKEIRGRMAILLSVELAIMTYLFSDLTSIFPQEKYGQAIVIIACLGVLVSIITLLAHYKSNLNWPAPTGETDRAKLATLDNEIEILKYIENDYFCANEEAQKILAKRAKAFNFSMHIFLISAIILLIIKIF